MLVTLTTIVFVVVCLVLCITILLQSSKGGLGSGLGGAQATQVFGGQGAGGTLIKITIGAAALFMLLSIALARLSSAPQSILGELQDEQATTVDEDEVIEDGTLDAIPAAQAPPSMPAFQLPPVIEEPPAQEAPAQEPPAQEAPAQEAPAETP